MVVEAGQAQADRYAVSLREHDERVELDGWTYYVRGVKRLAELRSGSGSSAFAIPILGVELVAWLVEGGLWVRSRRQPWTVGVVRFGSVRSWNDKTPRVVFSERLARGASPVERITELVDEVKAGRFRPV